MTRLRACAAIVAAFAMLPAQANAQTAMIERESVQEAYVARDFERAERILRRLLAEHPDDADLLRRLAAVQAALDDLDAAQATIDRAIVLAPDDPDIQLARANILFWRGRLAEAHAQSDQIVVEYPDYPGLDLLVTSLRQTRRDRALRLQSLGIGTSLSDAAFASGSSQTWYTQRGSISAQWGAGNAATLDIEREERLATDTRISGRIDLPVASNRYFVTGSVAPNADFRENWSIGGGAEIAFSDTSTLQIDGRFSEYRSDDVVAFGAGLRQRLSPALELSAKSIHLFGGGERYRLGGAIRADYHPSRFPEAFVILASYPDAEVDGTRQLRAVAGGVRFALSEKVVLGVTGEFESREASYERAAISVDLRWRIGER